MAAADAKNSHEGLFRTVSPKSVTIPYYDKDGKLNGSIYVIEPEPASRLEGSPLSSRAWVTQEIILSRRIICYTKYGLLWLCLSSAATEAGPKSTGEVLQRSTSWDEITSLYSAKQLTFYNDKLIALQGIANSLEKKSGDKYLAGLWANELPLSLLWSVKTQDFREAKRLPENLCFPSWSWISVQCAVNLKIPGMWAMSAKSACDKITVKDIEGKLQLQVQGHLASAPKIAIITDENMLRIGNEGRQVPINQVEMSEGLSYDFQQGPNFLPAAVMLCSRKDDAEHVIGWALMNDGNGDAAGSFVLRLISKDIGHEDPPQVSDFVLFLRQCGEEVGTYQRIGMGMIHEGSQGDWFGNAPEQQIYIV